MGVSEPTPPAVPVVVDPEPVPAAPIPEPAPAPDPAVPVAPEPDVVVPAAATAEELVDQHNKDALVTAANVVGVEVASGDTKADIAEKLVATQAPAAVATPVKVDGTNRRDDEDALEGLFCEIVSGEFAGRWGVFDHVLEYDAATGYPKQIVVITRDAHNESLSVAYSDCRPSLRTGGR